MIFGRVGTVQVLLEVQIRKFVGFLVAAVGLVFLLDGIVGEVNEGVPTHLVGELCGGSPNVPFLVPIGFVLAIDAGEKHVMANVELPSLVQERVFDVLLQDECPEFAVMVPFPAIEPDLDIIKVVAYSDPITLIGILPWLDYPNVPGILALILHLLVDCQELLVLWVFNPFLEVESHREDIKRVPLLQPQVPAQIVIQCLLIADVVIAVQMVVDQDVLGIFNYAHFLMLKQGRPPTVGVFVDLLLGLRVLRYVSHPVLVVTFAEYFEVFRVLGGLDKAIYRLPRLRLKGIFLRREDVVDFELSPYKVSLGDGRDLHPPESSFDDASDEVAVVAWADVDFVGGRVQWRRDVHAVRVVQLPQQVPIVLYLVLESCLSGFIESKHEIVFLQGRLPHGEVEVNPFVVLFFLGAVIYMFVLSQQWVLQLPYALDFLVVLCQFHRLLRQS